ncbi:putative cyclin-dependent protein kinase inhibitor SMR [Helianthus annuus]|nr:putative cyclin-dependent protein kinase inhibitor SMR [Helianthus annuus]
MAPSRKNARKPRRTLKKKKKMVQETNSLLCSDHDTVLNLNKMDEINSIGCTTPKAQKYQIPEILTCPPAPKKKPRLVSSCTLRRSPISFFDPPDIEVFFASHLASIYNHVHTPKEREGDRSVSVWLFLEEAFNIFKFLSLCGRV